MGSRASILILLLVGCAPAADTQLKISSPSPSVIENSAPFEVERVGVFNDDLAYGNRRGIYVIKDCRTGKRFVGISGVGISELGEHTVDDHAVSDER